MLIDCLHKCSNYFYAVSVHSSLLSITFGFLNHMQFSESWDPMLYLFMYLLIQSATRQINAD